jgi:hypothetical protein
MISACSPAALTTRGDFIPLKTKNIRSKMRSTQQAIAFALIGAERTSAQILVQMPGKLSYRELTHYNLYYCL